MVSKGRLICNINAQGSVTKIPAGAVPLIPTFELVLRCQFCFRRTLDRRNKKEKKGRDRRVTMEAINKTIHCIMCETKEHNAAAQRDAEECKSRLLQVDKADIHLWLCACSSQDDPRSDPHISKARSVARDGHGLPLWAVDFCTK